MEFRILGPLEVCAGDGVLPLRGRRQRALLAILVLHANEVVATERLIDELWGNEVPESGVTALQVRVSQLRRALEAPGTGGGDAIVTQQPGYLLKAELERIDARRFERLLAEGRALLAESEPVRAAEILREGLGLWRGPPLADFAYEPFAQAEIARLEELRLGALEERFAADLALGSHAEIVAELEALSADHPLRERLRAHQMLALYRCGRQADALAVYRDTRTSLVDELGIEPGAELRRLEQAILRQDTDLTPSQRWRAPRAEQRPPVSEERKVVSVVFADLVGSTTLTLETDPERTRAVLDRFYEGMAFEIDAAGGTIEKFVGDAVIAVFGAPVAQEDHAERALHAALAMRRRMSDLFGDQLGVRIGVATGEVVVGRARAGGAFVTGIAVNIGERLQRGAAPGEILVAARTARAAGAAFELGPATVVEAKGVPDGIECRSLVRALSLTQRRGVGGGDPVFVGRELELEILRTTYRRTAEGGNPSLLTVVGDAGVGKSRLLREWWDWLAGQSPAPLRRASRCFPAGKRITFGPLRDVLREEFGLLTTDPPDLARHRLGEREILGLALGLDVASDLHPLAARERLREAWVDLLNELVAERPAVLLVEDIHWAQDLLVELLEIALRDVQGSLLVVVTARPELLERPTWGRGHRDAATIWLDPLSPEESALLIEQLLSADPPPALRDLLVERAEGNPFFAEELLDRLLDEGIISSREGTCELQAPLENIAIPDSVQSVVAARLDLLPPTEKAALQAAAVIGRVFWRGPVRALLEGTPPDFSLLEARDFIRRRPVSSVEGEREFAFKHALTRDVAYASLPKARRARLHAEFADWLAASGSGRDEDAPMLAHHYAEAVRPEDADLAWAHDIDEFERLRSQALDWLRRAADLAVRRYEIDEGLDLLHRALELERTDDGRCELWRSIARANALKFDGEAMWTSMLTAIELTGDTDVEAELYAELAFQSACRSGIWKRMPEAVVVDRWIESALRLARPESRARGLALVARGFWNPFESGDSAAEACAIAERLGDLELKSVALEARGVTEAVAGRYEQGLVFVESRFEFLDEISDPDHRADIYAAPISGCVWSGDFAEARRLARLHDVTTEPLTPHHRLHGVAVLGEVEELLGGWERIRELEERTQTAVEENASTPCVRNARSLLVCAVARAVLGDPERAGELEERADGLGIEGYGLVLDTPRLRLALAREDLEAVERLLSTRVLERGWYHGWMALSTVVTRLDGLAAIRDAARLEEEAASCLTPGTYVEPFALRALGVIRVDERLVEQAACRFEALGLGWHASETRAVLL